MSIRFDLIKKAQPLMREQGSRAPVLISFAGGEPELCECARERCQGLHTRGRADGRYHSCGTRVFGILDHRVGGLGRRSIGHDTIIPEDYLPKDHNVPALRLSSLGQLLGRPGADKNHPATQ